MEIFQMVSMELPNNQNKLIIKIKKKIFNISSGLYTSFQRFIFLCIQFRVRKIRRQGPFLTANNLKVL